MRGAWARRWLFSVPMLAAACSGDSEQPGEVFDPSDSGSTGTDGTTGAAQSTESDGSTSDGGDSTTSGLDDMTTGGVEDDCPRLQVVVAAGASLNVRPTPSTEQEPIGSLPNNAIVDRLDDAKGETIEGNDLWYRVAFGDLEGYISAVFATCTFDENPDLLPPAGFRLPLECGASATISQGNFGDFSHQGNSAYAFDFSLGVGTPMVAIADGIVIHTYAETMPGDDCYDGGGPECFPYGNLVVLLHGDGTTSLYKHLSEVHVTDGEYVDRAGVVGLSGSTGYSTGPHAHVMRMEDCGEPNCQSIPLSFEDVPGDGVPTTGQTVTSDNCP